MTEKQAKYVEWCMLIVVERCVLNDLRKRMERMRTEEKQAKFLERLARSGSCVGEIRVWKKCELLPEAEQEKRLLHHFVGNVL